MPTLRFVTSIGKFLILSLNIQQKIVVMNKNTVNWCKFRQCILSDDHQMVTAVAAG